MGGYRHVRGVGVETGVRCQTHVSVSGQPEQQLVHPATRSHGNSLFVLFLFLFFVLVLWSCLLLLALGRLGLVGEWRRRRGRGEQGR